MGKISFEAQHQDIHIEGDVVGGDKGAGEKERPQEPEQKQGGITISWNWIKKAAQWLIPFLLSFVKSANANDK